MSEKSPILRSRIALAWLLTLFLIGSGLSSTTAWAEETKIPLPPAAPVTNIPPQPRSVVVVSDKPMASAEKEPSAEAASPAGTAPPAGTAVVAPAQPVGAPIQPLGTSTKSGTAAPKAKAPGTGAILRQPGDLSPAPLGVSTQPAHQPTSVLSPAKPAVVGGAPLEPTTAKNELLPTPAQTTEVAKPEATIQPVTKPEAAKIEPAKLDAANPTPAATPTQVAETPATEPKQSVVAEVAPLAETPEKVPAVNAPAEEASTAENSQPPTPTATTADASSEEATPNSLPHEEIAAATFREVEPGVTTQEGLITAWGQPARTNETETETTLQYQFAPFSAVEVRLVEGVVTGILVQIDGTLEPNDLAKKLKLDFIRTVEVRDEQGVALGRAFPERGVLFSYAPHTKDPQVAQILLETIDPQAFYLRAETFWRSRSAASLSDLKYVLEQNPEQPAAYHLQALIYLELDQIDDALAAVNRAIELDGAEQEYRLTLAQCHAQQSQFVDAVAEVEAVLAVAELEPLTKARGLLLRGNLASEGLERDFKSAINYHLEAIKIAEPLGVDPLVAQRRRAKEVLVEASLGVAQDIAWGNWNRKDAVVPKWVERADAYARDAITRDGCGLEMRIRVIERALAAHTGFKPAADPVSFLGVAEDLTARLVSTTNDPLARRAAEWQLGRIYSHAVRLSHLRGKVEEGLKYGEVAQQKLEQSAVGRESSAPARKELGRLYFHLGVLYAVHKQDHEQAVGWYDRAYALLATKSDGPATDPGQLGEMLVSMGVSYWQVDLKQKALELTSQGTELIKLAVEEGRLAAASLTIPYANLASMHQELGNQNQARELNLTAEKLETILRK